ncbi:MAG: molybdate ABC transporter permease subunit, partial [Burkholderiales bacterium]
MDTQALLLSLRLAAWTVVILLPVGIALGRVLAWRRFRGKVILEAALTLPLVLPPTVLGYYLLVALGTASPLGQWYERFT